MPVCGQKNRRISYLDEHARNVGTICNLVRLSSSPGTCSGRGVKNSVVCALFSYLISLKPSLDSSSSDYDCSISPCSNVPRPSVLLGYFGVYYSIADSRTPWPRKCRTIEFVFSDFPGNAFGHCQKTKQQ